jgi:hypothetical protein
MNEEYEFRVKGRLSDVMLAALDGLAPTPHAAEKVLTAAVVDGAELHGLIARFETLGLELTEVRQLPRRVAGPPATDMG